jgi:hypothetical protein
MILLDDVNHRLGYPRGHLASHPADYGLQITRDWAGRPALDEGQASALVDQVTADRAEARRAKQAATLAHAAGQQRAAQRLEIRARVAFDVAAEQFGDASAALALFYLAADGRVSDEQVAGQLGLAAARWREGYRTFSPQPVSGDETAQEVKDRLQLRDASRRAIKVRIEYEKKVRRIRQGGRS